MRGKLLIAISILASAVALAGTVIWHRSVRQPDTKQAQVAAIASPTKSTLPSLPNTRNPSQFPGGIDISLSGDAEMLLTDPEGRRTGSDVLSGHSFAESSTASAGDDSIDDPNDSSDDPVGIQDKKMEISPVVSGTYTLAVQSTKKGAYDLELHDFSPTFQDSKTTLTDVKIEARARHLYLLKGNVENGASLKVSGGFSGSSDATIGGGRLLSYASPTALETQLPAGTQTFSIIVCYDSRARADSFSAQLDGKPIRDMFHPAPGKIERVNIPLHGGSNQLVLSISGDSTSGAMTTRDRLEFVTSTLEQPDK